MTFDPVKLELIRHGLEMISDNMMVSVVRTARSTLVKNNLDFSGSICDADGNMVAQGLALPSHLGAIMPALRGCLDYFGDDIGPGDILATNDPYSGGSHLNDIFMFKPVYSGDTRVCILALILHHTDLGGRVAGGQAGDSDEIFQEGLRIPPSKITIAGQPNRTLLNLIEHNTRVPDLVMGDIRAQMAALNAADTETVKLAERYGVIELKSYMGELIEYAERMVRAAIRDLPDGTSDFTEWNDDDGVGGGPVRVHCELTIKGDGITADFSGTDKQKGGALHTNYPFTCSLTYAALRAVLPREIPTNAGFYRAIEVIAPEGSWVNPRFPAALGARGQGGYRIRTVVTGALSGLLPHRIPACPGGSEFGLSVAGTGANGKPFVHVEFHNMSGRGGSPDADGQDAGAYWLGNLSNTPVEVIEAENPLLIEEYSFLPDTGGPGRHRGALGIARQYRFLAEEVTVQQRADRHIHACWGLFGGGSGALGRSFYVDAAGTRSEAPSKFVRRMRRNEIFRAEMPGSGGHGEAFSRDTAAVAEDVRQEKMTRDHARDAYGVELEPESFTVDTVATASRRGKGNTE